MSRSLATVHMHAGEMVVSTEPTLLTTVLGSCVSVCLFSETHGVGGMIHFVLPKVDDRPGDGLSNAEERNAFRYGADAIPALIDEICRVAGCNVRMLRAKVVGGAESPRSRRHGIAAGAANVTLARQMLRKYGIHIVGEDTGGETGRKIVFHVPTGKLLVAKLKEPLGGTPAPVPAPHLPQSALGSTPAKAAPTRGAPLKAAAPKPATLKVVPSKGTAKRRVLIVDDSKTVRLLLAKIIGQDPQLEVGAMAEGPAAAWALLEKERFDVVTLDIHMPEQDGLTFLRRYLPKHAIPTVMISSINAAESDIVLRALEAGAVDYIQKPSVNDLAEIGDTIRQKILAAAGAKVLKQGAATRPSLATVQGAKAEIRGIDTARIVAIGASTGGPEAIRRVLLGLPSNIPPTVVVLHIPPHFSSAYARRLDEQCAFAVKEAEDGDWLERGKVLIAPGGKHMRVIAVPGGHKVRVLAESKVNGHMPSVDVLFESVARVVGKRSVGVILTGMGADGAAGLKLMRDAGSRTIGQDETSCVVYGMPREAAKLGAVEMVRSLDDVAGCLVETLKRQS